MKNNAPRGSDSPFSSANSALALLLLINLFNYIDRQVLAAMIGPIKRTYFTPADGAAAAGSDSLNAILQWFQSQLGFKPEDALLGLLGTAFMLTYMVGAPIFAYLLRKNRAEW